VTDTPGGSQTRGADDYRELEELARRGRQLVFESVATAGAGHIGGPLSAMDLLVGLYFRVMRIDPERPDWAERDRFILSKGHSAIGLYAAMALRGYLPVEELATFDAAGSRLQGHPDVTRLPGLDTSTGSLGQGLSVGIGMAMGARRQELDNHTWVLLGDGEMQEGQVWEAIQVAGKYGLGNITAIIDSNGMQQYGWAPKPGEERRGDRSEPFRGIDIGAAIEAFGWRVQEIDGHDFSEIIAACEAARADGRGDVPTMLIARTMKGQGVSFARGVTAWHARVPTADEVEAATAELQETKA
jgi:transketolase